MVSAAKGKSKVKQSARQSNVGDKLERLRWEVEFESLNPSSPLPIEDSEEVRAELENLPSPAFLLPGQEFQEPKELEEPEATEDLKEAEDLEEAEHLDEAEEQDAEEQKKSKSKTVQA